MTVAVVTPIYNREALTEKFLDYSTVWRNKLDERGIDTFPIAVISNETDGRLAERYKWTTLWHQNNPLSDKANVGFLAASLFDVDGALKLDSDDFPSVDFLLSYLDLCADVNFGHVRYLYVYDRPTRRCAGKEFSRVGSCRWLSRKALEACEWEPYETGLNNRLDGSMDRRLRGLGFEREEVRIDSPLITVKDGSNIWPYEEVIMGVRDETDPESLWRENYPEELANWMVQ